MIAEESEFQLVEFTGTVYNQFYERDLDELMDQDEAWNVVLKPARCLKPGCELGGAVHSVAVAIKYGGAVIAAKAALPCPPDCPVKLVEPKDPLTIPFKDYIVYTYMLTPGWLESILRIFGIKTTRSKRIR